MEIGEAARILLEERMVPAHDQTGFFDADLAHFEESRINVVRNAADDEIVPGGEQFPRENVAGLDLNVDLDARKRLANLVDGRNNKAHGRRCDRADEDGTALAALQFADLAAGLAQFQQNFSCTLGECLSESRQHDTAGDSFVKRRLNDRFHFSEHSGGGRLGDVQDLRRRGNLSAIFDCDDYAQVIQLQARTQKGIIANIIAVDIDPILGNRPGNNRHGCGLPSAFHQK
ncbi:hypothetical protein AJ87_13860 [Rhizobium yanglingense]|nr:hypothetical protein AJ87_13860 [Rhizobium yanglingense]